MLRRNGKKKNVVKVKDGERLVGVRTNWVRNKEKLKVVEIARGLTLSIYKRQGLVCMCCSLLPLLCVSFHCTHTDSCTSSRMLIVLTVRLCV